MSSVSNQPAYVKLSDVAGLMEAATGRKTSRQLAYKYTGRPDFPKPDAVFPFRLWTPAKIYAWVREVFGPDESLETYDKKPDAVALRQQYAEPRAGNIGKAVELVSYILGQINKPHKIYIGREAIEIELTSPPARDIKDLVAAASGLVDLYRLELGELPGHGEAATEALQGMAVTLIQNNIQQRIEDPRAQAMALNKLSGMFAEMAEGVDAAEAVAEDEPETG